MKVCIIVGHGKSKSGGYDSGAVSADGKYKEFPIAREIAKATHDALRAAGVDSTLMNYEGNMYLTDRIDKVNASDFDFVAEIHLTRAAHRALRLITPRAHPRAGRRRRRSRRKLHRRFPSETAAQKQSSMKTERITSALSA